MWEKEKQAFKEGKKIQWKPKHDDEHRWMYISDPSWSEQGVCYRVMPTTEAQLQTNKYLRTPEEEREIKDCYPDQCTTCKFKCPSTAHVRKNGV